MITISTPTLVQIQPVIMKEFPDIISSPPGGWNTDGGGALDPGREIKFWQDTRLAISHALPARDISEFPEYEVDADAFAALTLHRYKMIRQRILDAGYVLPSSPRAAALHRGLSAARPI